MEIALVILLLALPGLALGRCGPKMARLAALLALGAVGIASLNLPTEKLRAIPPDIAVVPTAPLAPAAEDVVRRRLAEPGVVRFETGEMGLGDRIGRARLRQREEPRLVLLWTGPVPLADRSARIAGAVPAAALSDVGVAPLDPDDIEVRVLTVPRADRPSAFEVAVGPARGMEVRGLVGVVDPRGRTVLEKAFIVQQATRIEWQPAIPGRHQVILTLHVGNLTYRGAGAVDVEPAPTVTIVGRRARTLARVLAVQGLRVRASTALPDELRGTLVLLDALGVADQERVRRFVEDDGGGLFLVGGEDGGGLPGAGEVLAALSPVRRPPVPATPPGERGSKGPGRDPRGLPDAKDSNKVPDKKESGAKNPLKNGDAAKGDTTGARIRKEEREVKRRAIAMVLVIDRSGSMSERAGSGASGTKMDIARMSALRTAEALDDDDVLGVVAFGTKASIVLDMVSVARRAHIRKSLESLASVNEGTFVGVGLDAARRMLVKAPQPVKHLVVISDGEFGDARRDELMEPAFRSAKRFAATGISVFVIQVVRAADQSPRSATILSHLTRIANQIPKGVVNDKYCHLQDFESVPRLVSAEVERVRSAVGRPSKRPGRGPGKSVPDKPDKPDEPDEPESPPAKPDSSPPVTAAARMYEVHCVEDSQLLRPRESDVFPPLAGVLHAKSKGDARVLLSAGTEGYVLLAFANRGLGKVGAWSSDFIGPWGVRWAADPAFPGRLAQWVQSLEPAGPAARASRVLHRPEISPVVVVPREAEFLASLAGSAVRPVETFISPSPRIRTEIRGRAPRHAWYGLVFLVLLAAVEFLSMRRSPRRTIRS